MKTRAEIEEEVRQAVGRVLNVPSSCINILSPMAVVLSLNQRIFEKELDAIVKELELDYRVADKVQNFRDLVGFVEEREFKKN
jgi:hypothetical protein